MAPPARTVALLADVQAIRDIERFPTSWREILSGEASLTALKAWEPNPRRVFA